MLNLFKILCFVILFTRTYGNNCKSVKCSLYSSEIRFPFRIEPLQPQLCGHPDFDLFCTHNKTMIHFMDYGNLVVKSIFYDTRRLNLLDPKNCVHEVLLNLNLSGTPFRYYYVVKYYNYINCSSNVPVSSSIHIPCLSGSTYRVYVVDRSFSFPNSCRLVKSVEIPFSYSPYVSDNSFGLGLTWDLTDRDHEEDTISDCKFGILCETGRMEKCLRGIIGLIFMAGVLVYIIIAQFLKESNGKKVKNKKVEVVHKLLGEYEALNPANGTKANVLRVGIHYVT